MRIRKEVVTTGLDTYINAYHVKDGVETELYFVCYFRKCWNVRRIIYQETGLNNYMITKDCLMRIKAELEKENTPEEWDESYMSGQTMWCYDDYHEYINEQIKDIQSILDRWDEMGISYCRHIDSY